MQAEPLAQAHLARVVMLEREVFGAHDPWPAMAFEGELELPQALWMVAKEGEKVLGYGGGWCVAEDFHLLNLAVAPDARRRGTGKFLLDALLSAALGRGCRTGSLEVREGNAAARALYERRGFKPLALRRNHYTDGSSAIFYKLDPLK